VVKVPFRRPCHVKLCLVKMKTGSNMSLIGCERDVLRMFCTVVQIGAGNEVFSFQLTV
jgi:hypothetical protein